MARKKHRMPIAVAVFLIVGSAVYGLASPKAESRIVLNVASQPRWSTIAMEKYIPEFEEEYGIDVAIHSYPEAELYAKIRSDVAEKIGAFQIYYTCVHFLPEVVEAGGLVPLLDYYPPEFDYNDFPEITRMAGSRNGVAYLAPFMLEGWILYYRKDLFEAKGLAVPTTVDEWMQCAEALYDPPNLYGCALRMGRVGHQWTNWGTFVSMYGGALISEDRKAVFDSPEAIKGTKKFIEIGTRWSPPGGAVYSWSDAMDAFATGKVATFADSTNFVMTFEDPKKSLVAGKVGYVPMPVGDAGPGSFLGNHGWGISAHGCKTEEEREAAGLYIAWWTSKEMEMRRLQEAFMECPRVSTWASPEMAEIFKDYPDFIEAFKGSLESAKATWKAMNPQPESFQLCDRACILLEEFSTGAKTDYEAEFKALAEWFNGILGKP